MAKPRVGSRLSDLNLRGMATQITGMNFETDPPTEETIHLWVRKLSPDEHDTCVRKASAARARLAAAYKDPDSEESMALRDAVEEWSTETIRAMLLADERRKHMEVVEAQLLGDEDSEWGKDDYLTSLREAWLDDPDGTPGLNQEYARDPDDAEAARVYAELKRFSDAAQNRIDVLVRHVVDELEATDREALVERILESRKKQETTTRWILEYDEWQLALGVRYHDPKLPAGAHHPEHKERYFENRQEVAETDPAIVEHLLGVYAQITVDIQAGKGSRPGPTSSPPSETPAEPEAVQPSSLQAVPI